MTVSWHKSDRRLMYSGRHRIVGDGSHHTLEIPCVIDLDSGHYTARAFNQNGCVETSCDVNVLPSEEYGYVVLYVFGLFRFLVIIACCLKVCIHYIHVLLDYRSLNVNCKSYNVFFFFFI